MRLYKLTGPKLLYPRFAGSKDAASAKRRELVEQFAPNLQRKDVDIVEVEVPTDKIGLIDFLDRLHA